MEILFQKDKEIKVLVAIYKHDLLYLNEDFILDILLISNYRIVFIISSIKVQSVLFFIIDLSDYLLLMFPQKILDIFRGLN